MSKYSEEVIELGFPERLKEAMKGASVNAFSKKCGLSASLVSSYLEGRNPGLVNVVRIARAADVSVEWLATGKEPGNRAEEERAIYKTADQAALPGEDFALVPRYEIRASAGPGETTYEEPEGGVLAFRRDWLRAQGLPERRLAVIEASGESMEPTIRPMDVLLLDLRPPDGGRHRDGIYVLRREDTLLVKRLQFRLGGRVRVSSDNEAYEAEEFSPEEFEQLEEQGLVQVVGRVVWIGRRV